MWDMLSLICVCMYVKKIINVDPTIYSNWISSEFFFILIWWYIYYVLYIPILWVKYHYKYIHVTMTFQTKFIYYFKYNYSNFNNNYDRTLSILIRSKKIVSDVIKM
jgi:hypothetical protein